MCEKVLPAARLSGRDLWRPCDHQRRLNLLHKLESWSIFFQAVFQSISVVYNLWTAIILDHFCWFCEFFFVSRPKLTVPISNLTITINYTHPGRRTCPKLEKMDQDSFRRFWRQKGAKIWPLISRYKLQQKKRKKMWPKITCLHYRLCFFQKK